MEDLRMGWVVKAKKNKVINNNIVLYCVMYFGVIMAYNGNAAIQFTSIELELIWLENSKHKRVRTAPHKHTHTQCKCEFWWNIYQTIWAALLFRPKCTFYAPFHIRLFPTFSFWSFTAYKLQHINCSCPFTSLNFLIKVIQYTTKYTLFQVYNE